jgi:hypothetical protein
VIGLKGKGAHPGAISVRREEFARDPSRFIQEARARGPVTVIDAEGKPRIMIVAPKTIVGYDDV